MKNKFAYHYITYHFEVNPMLNQVKHVNFQVNHLTPDCIRFSAITTTRKIKKK